MYDRPLQNINSILTKWTFIHVTQTLLFVSKSKKLTILTSRLKNYI